VLYPGDPAGRADAFLARLDAACPGWRDRPFILQADCEKWNGNSATVPSKANIRVFCDRLVEKASKLRPVVYGPKWVYGDGLFGLNYPLWASSYVTGAGGFKTLYPGDSSSHWGAYSGQTPEILQFTSSATIGGQTTCDANAYRGTKDQLEALLAPGWSQDMTAPTAADNAKAAWADYRIKNAYSGVMQSPETLLSYAASATGIAGYVDTKLAPRFQAIADFLATMAANAVTEADVSALQTSIGQVDENVLADLADAGRTDQEVADALKAALGARAAAVGALLAGPA
jgi:hypothetical protein